MSENAYTLALVGSRSLNHSGPPKEANPYQNAKENIAFLITIRVPLLRQVFLLLRIGLLKFWGFEKQLFFFQNLDKQSWTLGADERKR